MAFGSCDSCDSSSIFCADITLQVADSLEAGMAVVAEESIPSIGTPNRVGVADLLMVLIECCTVYVWIMGVSNTLEP